MKRRSAGGIRREDSADTKRARCVSPCDGGRDENITADYLTEKLDSRKGRQVHWMCIGKRETQVAHEKSKARVEASRQTAGKKKR